MLARTAEAAKMTLESTEMLHSPDAITDLIRLYTLPINLKKTPVKEALAFGKVKLDEVYLNNTA
jgi:hypothetical protein